MARKKRSLGTIKIILLTLAGLYLVVGVVFYLFQESIIFLAEELDIDYKFQFQTSFQERDFTMEDGAVLNAVHFKVDSARGVILYFHGNAGSLSRWGDIGDDLTRFGYDVLIFDFRGYGKSTGSRTMEKLFSDGQAIYDELKMEYTEDQIVIYGRSLGTGMATWLASHNKPGKLLLETPFYSLSDVAGYHYPVFPIHLLMRFPFPSYIYIDDVTCPILFFHGTNDKIVPYESGEKLYKKVPPEIQAELITIPNGGHNDLSGYELYWEKLEIFLR